MLAALIATRVVPPPPPVFFYTNRLVAATTTFTCITITRRSAFLTTSLPDRYILNLSVPGQESFLDQLNRMYRLLIGQQAGEDPIFLSATIAQTIRIVSNLLVFIQVLPVSPQNVGFLATLQQRLALALSVLKSLGQLVV